MNIILNLRSITIGFVAVLSGLVSRETLGITKVGFIGPFSGPAQAYGDACRNGFELALDDVGRGLFSVTYEDDQFQPSKSASAYRKLVESDHVEVVVVLGSSSAKAIAAQAQRDGIPLFAWASDPAVSRERSSVLRTFPPASSEGAEIAKEALKRGYKRMALVTASTDYAHAVKTGLLETAGQGAFVLVEEYRGEERDFRALLTKVRTMGLDAIGMCLGPGQSGTLARQARELGIKVDIFGCEALEDREEAKIAQGALRGAWYVTIGVDPKFRQRYLEKFKNENILSGAAAHYDVVLALHKSRAVVLEQTKVIPALLSLGKLEGAEQNFVFEDVQNDRYLNAQLVVQSIEEKL